ncbi:MAG: hypothetical protein J6Y91_06295 [Alphaproteobacteria bacterium]|nr:hypothetical protein [Alphaproteobacteria bacterium]
MKKVFLFSILALTVGCADLSSLMGGSSGGTATDSNKAKLTSCMMSEANTRLQAGTLFNDTVMATAKDISGTCVKKLALESMGISSQAQSEAANIINSLRNLSGS